MFSEVLLIGPNELVIRQLPIREKGKTFFLDLCFLISWFIHSHLDTLKKILELRLSVVISDSTYSAAFTTKKKWLKIVVYIK